MKRIFVLLSLIFVLLAGCGLVTPEPTPTPTALPTLTPTLTPTNTPTPLPTATPLPTITPTPACVFSNEFLRSVKDNMAWEEFMVDYAVLQGEPTLTVWYVDPLISLNITGDDEFEIQLAEAFVRGVMLITDMKAKNPCLAEVVTMINLSVVDRNYNGWVLGMIAVDELSDEGTILFEEAFDTAQIFEFGFLRQEAPAALAAPPAGACTWQEAREALHQHFAPERENVGFQFMVLDGVGTTVWAQWDGSSDPLFASVNLMNVLMELECLYPAPTGLVVVVVDEETGQLGLYGEIEEENGVLSLDNFRYLVP